MTLNEVNSKIEGLEKELKRMKELKKQLKTPLVNVCDLKEEWINRTEEIIQRERTVLTAKDFCAKHASVYDDGSKRWTEPLFYLSEILILVYRFGFKDLKNGMIANRVWNDRVKKIIRSVTNGKATALNNRNGDCNLTETELIEFKRRLKDFIDDWCRQWAL